ncbi:1028_t:CDS:10, partial [Paraglomus brasilianum]
MASTSTFVIAKENKLINKVKKLNTEKLIEFLSEEIQLDECDLDIIREKKVSGRAFIKLTEDKLEEWGIADGSVLAIADFVEELRGEECEFSKQRKVEDKDIITPLATRVKYIFHISGLTISYACMDPPILWTPAADAWKEGLAHLLGPITVSVILLMNILSALTSYFDETYVDNWSHIDCLEYLAKVCPHLTSEDRIEILESYKAKLRSISSSQSMLQKSRMKAFKLVEAADRSFKRNEVTLFFEELDTKVDTNATNNLANATNNLANAKGNLLQSKLKVHAYNNIINPESGEDLMTSRKRKHEEEENGLKTPPLRSPLNEDALSTLNKRQMSDEKVIQYLNSMEQSLKYNQVTVQTPSLWTESLKSYINNVLEKPGDEFKMEIMRKIEGDEGNKFRLYCEKILMDFYNLVDVFPNLSRKIGERKYIIQNISSLFKFYESTFGDFHFDWIETHWPASKLTKSRTYSGIVKVDARGVRVFDDKEIFHIKASDLPSLSSSQHRHAVNDATKSIHTDILNLIAILLDHLRVPVENATEIKVFSLQAIEYRVSLYSLNMLKDGTFLTSELYSTLLPFSLDAISKYKGILYMMAIFHEEVTKQMSIMKKIDLIDHNEESTVRDVLKIPKALKDLLL